MGMHGNTVNLYNTTSKLLINGKKSDDLLDRDIHHIHSITATALDSEHSLHHLNNAMTEQLQHILKRSGQQPRAAELPEKTQDEKSQDQADCIKCNKACIKKKRFVIKESTGFTIDARS